MITLRFATVRDSAALVEIYRPYVERTSISFETETPSVAVFSGRIADFSEKFPYILAEEDGIALGYAYAHAFHDRAAYGWTVETSIYVAQQTRSRHVGKRLYQALLDLLTLQGIRNACAVIAIPNQPSLAFHKAMGFDTGGTLPDFGYKLGQWHSVVYLYKALGRGEPAPVVPIGSLDPQAVADILMRAETIS